MITVLEVLPVNRSSVIKVYRDTETNAFSHWEYKNLDLDPVEVRYYPEQATIVYDEPIPAAACTLINNFCKAETPPLKRRRALYASAVSQYLSDAYDTLSSIVAHRSNNKPQAVPMLKHTAVARRAQIDKSYRWLLEIIDPIALDQYDDYYQHVMEGK